MQSASAQGEARAGVIDKHSSDSNFSSMDAPRAIRHWFTNRLMDATVSAAPRLPESAIPALESLLARVGPHAPILSSMVAGNLRAAGLYSPQAHREYFARAAQHLSGLMHVLRQGSRHGAGVTPELLRVVEQRIRLDGSIERLREAHAGGRGVVVLGVHAANFMLVLVRLSQHLPVTVYLRHSKNPSRQAVKRRWCEASGLDYIAEPPSAVSPVKRAEILADVLRAGRVLIITPDLAQKRDDGVPVRLLDREVYLPGGPAGLALLTDAPLVTVVARPAGQAGIELACRGPYANQPGPRRRGWRQEAVRQCCQWFADIMAADFLRPHPALWFLWGDKRWTRVFRGDPRYTRPLEGGLRLEA